MIELKEQRREGYDDGGTDGHNEGRVEAIANNVPALIAETGWSTDIAFDVLYVSAGILHPLLKDFI